MTKKEILKLIMILYGYDRNIEIGTINSFQSTSYDMYAEGKDPEDTYVEYSEDFMMALTSLIDYIRDNKLRRNTDYMLHSIPTILDDNERMKIISHLQKRDDEHKEWVVKYEPVQRWKDENHPCPNCAINKKDHWDIIHYNCELCHTRKCIVLNNFWAEYDKIYSKHFK